MMEPRPPTLDQLQVFLAVVAEGSFSAAARRLRRATSVISYTIANLEAQLGLQLFDRTSTKTPKLTEAGQAVLADSRGIAHAIDDLLAKARGLQAGLEAEVVLVVDVMAPMRRLVQVFDAFRTTFPTVTLRLYVEAMGAVAQSVLSGQADLGVSGPLAAELEGLERRQMGSVRLVPVAVPTHPLAAYQETVPMTVAAKQLQLVLTDRSPLTQGREFAVIGTSTWRLADLGAKHELLLGGIGWGSLPEEMAAADIAAGRLIRLNIDTWDNITYQLQAIHKRDKPLGPAGRWLVEQLSAILAPQA